MTRTETYQPPRPNGGEATLRGGRDCTEAWDTSDTVDIYQDLFARVGDPVAASILTVGLLFSEAVKGSRS